MKGRLSLALAVAAMFMLCGCSSYEVTSSGDPAPLTDANAPSPSLAVSFHPAGEEPIAFVEIVLRFPPGSVKLEVFNVSGHLVKKLLERDELDGYYVITWDCTNDDGERINPGLYIYRMDAGGHIFTEVDAVCWTSEDCDKLKGDN